MITAIVPAWNESARIGAVLSALVGHPMLSRVLVVDDGSTDGTARAARLAGAEVLALPVNGGKTAALAAGIAASRTPFLMLIDADLLGLGPEDIARLALPVLTGRSAVTLSLRGNAPRPWHWLGVDYISGERVLPRSLIEPVLDRLPGLPRFGFEVFLNALILDAGLQPEIIAWPGVASPPKVRKQGIWPGLRADARMLRDMMRTVPPLGLMRQIAAFSPRLNGAARDAPTYGASTALHHRP
ncbi:MAG: glycosyltransferase [Rhodobacter sp.]|uniref:glycosyltransferase n=1 Tax=Pararhodobacter sp. TaxID=2127056 RepID=UPI002D1FA0A5|nr:glycosyltransferase [Pararhodobacter sp.]MCC0072720.1 glycosyltransferase [Rhodobacter sp.]